MSDPVNQVRRGIKTIEVQAPLLATLAAWVADAAGILPQRYAAYATALSLVLITASRTAAKLGDPTLNQK